MMLENGSRDVENATRQEAKEGGWSDDAPVKAFGRASFSHSGVLGELFLSSIKCTPVTLGSPTHPHHFPASLP